MELAFACSGCGKQLRVGSGRADELVVCDCGVETKAPPLRLGPGLVLGGFLLESKLGKGAMGDVFLGRQLSMDRPVAVKTLPAQMTLNEEAVGRFLNEVQITAQMSHPNIVTAFDAGEDEGTYYFAMAYVEGTDYKKLVERDGPLSEAKALEVVYDVSRALRYAWEEFTILHRDVKPENVMVDRHGTVRLMDMGISKAMNQDGGMTVEGMVVGTPHYMSPEQAWSEDPPDFHADMYSVGATAYFLLTGAPPYSGTVQAVFQMLAKPEPIKPIREANPKLSAAAAVLIDTMLSPDPMDRHPTWEAFLEDLALVRAGKMPKHRRPTVQAGRMWPTTSPEAKGVDTGTAGMTLSLKKIGGDQPATPTASTSVNTRDEEDETEEAVAELSEDAEEADLEDVAAMDAEGEDAPEERAEAAVPAAPAPPPAAPPPPPPAAAPPPKAEEKKSGLRLARRDEEPKVPPIQAPPVAGADDDDESGGMGKIIGIAVAVVAVLVVGGVIFGMMGGDDAPPPVVDPIAAPSDNGGQDPSTPPPPPKPVSVKPPVATVTPAAPQSTARWVPISAADKDRLEATVSARMANASIAVDSQTIAKRLGLPWPIPAAKSKTEVEEMVERQVMQQVNATHVARALEDYMEPALKRFGPYQIGTQVELTLRYGKGTVRGVLRQVGTTDFRIDDETYPLHHLETADRDRMSEVTAKAKAEEQARAWYAANEARRKAMADEIRPAIRATVYKASGLIQQKGEWASAQEILTKAVEAERIKLLAAKTDAVRDVVYSEAGYSARGGVWGKMTE